MPQYVTIANAGSGKNAAVQVLASGATLLTAGISAQDRKSVTVQNLGPNNIWIGFSSSVTTATGFKVAANGGTFSADYGSALPLYAIASTADQASPADTRVIETQ